MDPFPLKFKGWSRGFLNQVPLLFPTGSGCMREFRGEALPALLPEVVKQATQGGLTVRL